MIRVRACLFAAAASALLAGCNSAGGSSQPTWGPSPEFSGEGGNVQVSPIVPVPSLGAGNGGAGNGGGSGSNSSPGSGGSGSGSPSKGANFDPLVVAKHLTAPTGLTMLPNNAALVGERTTGRIVLVHAQPNLPVPTVRTLHGLDTKGDGGLLDLALSPTYAEDSLIYAYVTTRTDNRVIEFTLHGPVTTVLAGIPKGRSDNTGRIMFDAANRLYIGTGDAGRPTWAADPKSRAGKVLRVSDIGGVAPGNPSSPSPDWTSGHQAVDGLCTTPDGTVFEVEPGGPAAPNRAEINRLLGGSSYGWPADGPSATAPFAMLPATDGAPGGCAVSNGTLYVASLDGRALLSGRLLGRGRNVHVDRFVPLLTNKYGRLRTVVAATDGALWLTTSNRDGNGEPVSDDERVIRYVSPSGGGGSNPA